MNERVSFADGYVAEVINKTMRGERVTTPDLFGALGEIFGAMAGGAFSPAGNPWQSGVDPEGFDDEPAPPPTPPPRARPRNPFDDIAEAARRARARPVDPNAAKVAKIIDAKRTLGFEVREKLTLELVKARRRELAMKHHPDRGGTVEAMQKINAAADLLEQALAARAAAQPGL